MGLYLWLKPLCSIIWYSPLIKSTNQQGCIKTSHGNPREPSRHLIGQYSSSGHLLTIAPEVLFSMATAIAVSLSHRCLSEAIAGAISTSKLSLYHYFG